MSSGKTFKITVIVERMEPWVEKEYMKRKMIELLESTEQDITEYASERYIVYVEDVT